MNELFSGGPPGTALENLTPHEVTILIPNSEARVTVPPSGVVARVMQMHVCPDRWQSGEGREGISIATVAGTVVPLYVRELRRHTLEGLPAPRAGTLYLCSSLAAEAAWQQGREDVVCPGRLHRDEAGNPVGCWGLVRRPLPEAI